MEKEVDVELEIVRLVVDPVLLPSFQQVRQLEFKGVDLLRTPAHRNCIHARLVRGKIENDVVAPERWQERGEEVRVR